MSILKYVQTGETSPAAEQLKAAHLQGLSTRTMLMALGDYWQDYFLDQDSLIAAPTGTAVMVSEVYSQLLDKVLSSSILTIPVEEAMRFRLIVFSEDDFEAVLNPDGHIEYYAVSAPDVASLEYLASSLFEPEVLLEAGTHFSLHSGELRFYVDLFNDPGIFSSSYILGTGQNRKILLWATNIALVESRIYERYGHFLYSDRTDSEDYKQLVTALLYFYANAKSVPRIEAIINILFGLPFSRVPGEQVLQITPVDDNLQSVSITDTVLVQGEEATFGTEPLLFGGVAGKPAYVEVTTDYNRYYAFPSAELLVEEGQVLGDYELLARFHKVNDYKTDPDWYDGTWFPSELVEGDSTPFENTRSRSDGSELEVRLYQIMNGVLKYNILHILTLISYETYDYWSSNNLDLSEFIQSGLPVYLYPLIETTIQVEPSESEDTYTSSAIDDDTALLTADVLMQSAVPKAEDTASIDAAFVYEDSFDPNAPLYIYNLHNNTIGRDGSYTYGGKNLKEEPIEATAALALEDSVATATDDLTVTILPA